MHHNAKYQNQWVRFLPIHWFSVYSPRLYQLTRSYQDVDTKTNEFESSNFIKGETMSRTVRKASQIAKRHLGKETVKDGTFTKSSKQCENHGGCPYCLSNKMHKHKKSDVIDLVSERACSDIADQWVDVSSL
jgi:hypothetical protein